LVRRTVQPYVEHLVPPSERGLAFLEVVFRVAVRNAKLLFRCNLEHRFTGHGVWLPSWRYNNRVMSREAS